MKKFRLIIYAILSALIPGSVFGQLNGVSRNDVPSPEPFIGVLISFLILVFRVSTIVGGLGLVISLIIYLIAAGDEDRIRQSKVYLGVSILAIIIPLAAILILNYLKKILI